MMISFLDPSGRSYSNGYWNQNNIRQDENTIGQTRKLSDVFEDWDKDIENARKWA